MKLSQSLVPVFASAVLGTTVVCARASELPSHVDVRADHVSFFPYQNATLLAAEGHVVVHEGTRTIRGDALRYDVIKNTLLVTGNVRVVNRTRDLIAAAYALDMPSGNAEVLRIADVPATYAVHDDDLAAGTEGPPPKDVFAQLDIDGVRPYIRSRHAIVTPGAGVRMSPADFPTPVGPAVRLPTFLYTIVQNRNITQTSLPGSTFDQPLNLTGSPGSLLAAHLRYDSYYGPTIGFDERLVNGDRSYAVVSLIPFRDRTINAIAFEAIRPGMQQMVYFNHTFGPYPYTSATYKLQNTDKYTTQTFQTDLSGTNNDIGFDLATISHDVGHYFTYSAHAGYSYNHTFDGFPVADDFRKILGGTVQAPSFALAGTSFDERYDYTYTAYDYPHQLSDGTATFRVSRNYNHALFAGSVSFEQTDDRFRDPAVAAEALGLPDPTTNYYAPDGTLFPGYFAFAGLSTYRTYQGSVTLRGSGDNQTIFTLAHTADFPQYHGFGRPPLTATLDVTRRISPLLRIELARSYTFGWDGRYLSPQYSLSISP
jgi:hypothetical protein